MKAASERRVIFYEEVEFTREAAGTAATAATKLALVTEDRERARIHPRRISNTSGVGSELTCSLWTCRRIGVPVMLESGGGKIMETVLDGEPAAAMIGPGV